MIERLRSALPQLIVLFALAWASIWLFQARGPDLVTVRLATLVAESQARDAYGVPGQAVKLPHFALRADRREAERIVYTLTLDGDAGRMIRAGATASSTEGADSASAAERPPRHALLFPQLINGGDFYLNGQWVAGLPRSTAADRYVWYRPLLIPLPARLLNQDGRPNVLTVEQATHEPYVLISAPLVGRMEDLALVEGVVTFLSGTLAHASNLFCLVAGLFMIGAWIASPRERIFALAGAAMVLWGALFTLALWSHVPMDRYALWRTALYAAEGGLITLMSMFVLSFAGQPMGRRATRLLVCFAAVAPVVYMVGGSPTEYLLDRLWTGPMVVFYAYANIPLARLALRPNQGAAKALLLQSIFCIVLAVHDLGVLTGLLVRLMPSIEGWYWHALAFEPIYLCHLGLPLLLLVVGYILLVQHQRSVEGLNNANVVLKQTLAEREAELVASYEEQQRLAKVEAARLERDRIYQDVHDGIGSRLITTLFSVRKSGAGAIDIEAQLQACIDDMRLVLYAHQDEESDLQSCVFDYCLKLETQLEGSGLQLTYDIDDGDALHLPAAVRVNVLRILQEAVTNCIKHAAATALDVSLRIEASELLLDVVDNGRGLNARPERPTGGNGKGIPGLTLRAASMGGQCIIGPASPGTRVRLILPLDRREGPLADVSDEVTTR